MRKLITILGMVGVAGLSAVSGSNAAPVSGYDALYNAVISSCSLPDGTVDDCASAITAYSGALITADVDIGAANQSFSEARSEVFALNAADPEFQAAIDALFEELLPDSGAIGPVDPSPVL